MTIYKMKRKKTPDEQKYAIKVDKCYIVTYDKNGFGESEVRSDAGVFTASQVQEAISIILDFEVVAALFDHRAIELRTIEILPL